MTSYTAERLAEVSRGYDLDGGGYDFENPSQPQLQHIGAMTWTDPDLGYWPVPDEMHRDHRGDTLLLAFRPLQYFEQAPKFPRVIADSDDECIMWYRKVSEGACFESERECYCQDHNDDGCERCCDGLVVSEAGAWAIYVWEERPKRITDLDPDSPLQRHVARWLNRRAQDYDGDVTGPLAGLAYGGCASGMASHLVYAGSAVAFYEEHMAEVDRLLYEVLLNDGERGPMSLFPDWDETDPLGREAPNKTTLAWFAFEETARHLVDRNGIEV
ncbi:MAG: hypothetical protein GY700_06530 [Propionibacteriaceae bacterium]|nr:hypothetical protein [Propionibacteriaceae bacterium]